MGVGVSAGSAGGGVWRRRAFWAANERTDAWGSVGVAGSGIAGAFISSSVRRASRGEPCSTAGAGLSAAIDWRSPDLLSSVFCVFFLFLRPNCDCDSNLSADNLEFRESSVGALSSIGYGVSACAPDGCASRATGMRSSSEWCERVEARAASEMRSSPRSDPDGASPTAGRSTTEAVEALDRFLRLSFAGFIVVRSSIFLRYPQIVIVVCRVKSIYRPLRPNSFCARSSGMGEMCGLLTIPWNLSTLFFNNNAMRYLDGRNR